MTDYDELRREAEALLLLREEKPTEAPYSPLEQRMAPLIARLLPALEDARRLDALEALTKRTGVFGHHKKITPLTTDIHIVGSSVTIYGRTGIGSRCEFMAGGESVRAAIDALKEANRGQ